MQELVIRGTEAETKKREPMLGVKQKPWWPFIPFSNYMIPLLHCEIGIGYQMLEKLHHPPALICGFSGEKKTQFLLPSQQMETSHA
jgi:hypothetical protein